MRTPLGASPIIDASLVASTILVMSLLLGGCVTSHAPFRGNGQWESARESMASIIVMQPKVSMGSIDDEGELQLRHAAQEAARTNVQVHVQKILRTKFPDVHVTLSSTDPTGNSATKAAHAAFEKANLKIIGGSYAPGAKNTAIDHITLGTLLREAEIKADVAVFVWSEDFTAEGSYVAREVGKEIAGAVLASSGVTRVGDRSSSPEFPRGMSAAVVRVSDGAILWFNYKEYHYSMGLDDKRDGRRFVEELLRGL